MALTLSQAITEVRNGLNEDISVFWSDTEIEGWLKEGCKDFSTKSLMIEDDLDIILATNKIIYTSSDEPKIASILEPYAGLYNDGSSNWNGIIKAHPRMIGNESMNKSGRTRYYSLHNKKIYIWPPPSSTIVGAGAYIKLLYAMETDDITLFKDEYQHIPIWYAKAMALFKDRRHAEGSSYMALYSSSSSFEREDKHGREQDSLDMFKIKPRGGERGAA
jgi:hypothetical protein